MVGSGSSHRPSSRSRWGLPATARDLRPTGRPSFLRRATIASRICLARLNAPSAEWKVPPEAIAPARTTPRSLIGSVEPSCCTVNQAPRSCGIESKPHACTIRAPDCHGLVMVLEVHPVDELRLSGQVHVVGAGDSAGREQQLAELQVGPDRGDHDPRRLGHGAKSGLIRAVGLQQRELGERGVDLGQPLAHVLELALVAACQRPPEVLGGVLGEVGSGQLTGEAGGAEDDDVVVADRVVGGVRWSAGKAFSWIDGVESPSSLIAGPREPGGLALRPSTMETPAWTALGGGLISILAVSGMVAVGVAVDPSAPPAGAAELTPFSDCDDLQAWYVDNTIGQVGPYGWGGRRWTTMREDRVIATRPRSPPSLPGPVPARTPAPRRRGSPTGRPARTPRRPGSTSPTWPRPTGGSSYDS